MDNILKIINISRSGWRRGQTIHCTLFILIQFGSHPCTCLPQDIGRTPVRTWHESHANAGKCNNPYKKLRVHKMEGPESDQCAVNFSEEDEDSNEKMKELQRYIEMVQQIVKPGCSPEVVEAALRSMASLVEFLSSVSSKVELISLL